MSILIGSLLYPVTRLDEIIVLRGKQVKSQRNRKPFSILRIYTGSCLFFICLSILSVYNYQIYDQRSLVIFYIYELIFWLGIKAGEIRFIIRRDYGRIKNVSENVSFSLNRQGQIIIHIIYVGALLSFVYFLYLYRGSFNITSFGASLKAKFDEVARTRLEVITQFIMFAGSAVYLIVIGAKNTVSRATLRMARICLFLPGLRGAFLGRRFTLAIETLIFFFSEYESIKTRIRSMEPKDKKTIKRVFVVIILVVAVLLYIFSQRIVYLPEAMLIASPGDMQLKPFWKQIYSQIGNRMSILAYVSFYSSHAPYAFSYSYANLFPDFPRYWGLSTFRVFIQIITNLLGIHPNYAEMAYQVPGIARYTGYSGAMIQDFGKYLSPFISFFFGFIFSRIERGRNSSSVCHSLYPLIQVACLFAPVYFFSVGNIDQVAIWAIILAPFCLSKYEVDS